MEKRVLLAIALAVLVLFLFRSFEDRRVKESGRQTTAAMHPASTTPASPPTAAPPPALPAEQPPAGTPASADTSGTQQTLVIAGDLYRAVLDNKGAFISGWQLNGYRSGNRAGFEMIAANHSPDSRPYPGALILEDSSLTALANGEFYEVEAGEGGRQAGPLAPPVTVTMRLRRGELQVVKTYRFHKDNFLVDLSISVGRAGKSLPGRVLVGEDIGPEYEHLLNPSFRLSAVYQLGSKVKREAPPKEENQVKRLDGDFRWAGLDMHYFAVVFIPNRPLVEFEIQRRPVKTQGLDQKEVSRDLLRLTLPTSGVSQFLVYLGPKKQSFLDAVRDADLSGLIDYGMFWFLVRPLLTALEWIDKYAHNYGFSIILLTLFLTLLLFPFRLKQMLSMKKMAVVQPKVKEIQERYKRYKKTDPRRAEMNQEIMALYKEHNVNPLGGCLPLILQMPLLFAFYQLLAASIELRQAPFVGWILDLSQKDPYYVLPIVMGITMLISQKMTPMAPGADPAQAKMMMLMPVIFTVMFLNVSSGLNLYFLCSNIFQIAFQKIAERWVGDGRSAARPRNQ